MTVSRIKVRPGRRRGNKSGRVESRKSCTTRDVPRDPRSVTRRIFPQGFLRFVLLPLAEGAANGSKLEQTEQMHLSFLFADQNNC